MYVLKSGGSLRAGRVVYRMYCTLQADRSSYQDPSRLLTVDPSLAVYLYPLIPLW